MSGTEITLALTLLITQGFWGYIVHRLINKIMSRTYFDVVMADKKAKEDKKTNTNPGVIPMPDPVAADNAKKANTLFGLN